MNHFGILLVCVVITMYSEVLKLLKATKQADETGEIIETTTEREVFAKMLSIGQQEFYQAQATGLKPELKFEIADHLDYEDEKELIHEGKKYQVLRTYRKNRQLEITVYGGVNIGTS